MLEVAEPAWTEHWLDAQPLIDACRPRGTAVVTYALDNRPPAAVPVGLARLDAVVYGSRGAADAYRRSYPGAGTPRSRVISERLAPCPCLDADAAAVPPRREVLFAAVFEQRKGVDVLLRAWDQASPSGWRLRLLGWGPLLEAVRDWAVARPDAEVVADADRATVHEALRRARVVVLPSRVEQVGLSLVEGRAHGCRLVATTATGIAAALRDEGHHVVAPGDPGALASALSAVTASAGLHRDHRRGTDNRLAAVDWLGDVTGRPAAGRRPGRA